MFAVSSLSFILVLRRAVIARGATLSHEEEAQPHREAYEAAERDGRKDDAIKSATRLAQIYEAFAKSAVKVGFDVGVEVKSQFWGKRDSKGVVREKGWIIDKGQHVLFAGKITEMITGGTDEGEEPCSTEKPCARVAWDDGDTAQIVPLSRMAERASRAHEGDLKKKARATSVKWLGKAAQHGDVRAMNNLGTFYEKEDLNEDQALSWYRKAAEKDHHLAKYNVGGLLYHQQEYMSAMEWYKKAHEGGYVQATRAVAVMYTLSQGTRPEGALEDKEDDQMKALAWYQKAADRGCSQSMADLGQRLHEAMGAKKSKKNKKIGIEWLKKAAEQGESRAQGFLDDLEKEAKEKKGGKKSDL